MASLVWQLSQNRYGGTLKVPTNQNTTLNNAVDGATYTILYHSLKKHLVWNKADGQWIQLGIGIGPEEVMVKPLLHSTFTMLDNSNNPYYPPTTPTDYYAEVVRGIKVSYSSSYYYILGNDEVIPDKVTGDYGDISGLPADGIDSIPIVDTVGSDTTTTVNFIKEVVYLDNQTKSAKMDIKFKDNIYIGGIHNKNATNSELNTLVDSELYDPYVKTITRTDIDVGGNYFLYIAFPVSMGKLTNVFMNHNIPIGTYAYDELGVRTLLNSANFNVDCNVYRSTVRMAYPSGKEMNSLTFVF